MLRRRSAFAVAASGVLAVAVATTWVRQLWGGDDFKFYRYGWPDAAHVEESTVSVCLSGGGIIFHTDYSRHLVAAFVQQSAEDVREQYRPRKEFRYTRLNPLPWENPWYPFFGRRSGAINETSFQTVHACVPLAWLQVVTLLVPGIVLFKRVRTSARRRCGCCPDCGYDLRATPDRCPECGMTVADDAERRTALASKLKD